ncbi:hypothetical protein AcW1_002244 [Taiwanofungus camphoratus]|nr:hypothetical protein AcW1_002244 [Antrodia cinnamomea]
MQCSPLLPASQAMGHSRGAPNRAYILQNSVTHRRLLPTESAHSFSYPTLALLVSLNALESHSLDLARGWVFGYGGLYWRITGLRSSAYLTDENDSKQSIKSKLLKILSSHGYDERLFDDAWMMTMPSYLGFEGINPLTVYFCYQTGGNLWIVVLEIHNTFGERHVHVLKIGLGEDPTPFKGFQHQWTFPRQFHVSPFNDRSGFYTVSITSPPHHPSTLSTSDAPRPKVRVHLHALEPASPNIPGPLKLTAVLHARKSYPLTSRNFLSALTRQPFVLMLSFARILYHAWILYHQKRLDIYVRPEPKPVQRDWGGTRVPKEPRSGGIGWQSERFSEIYARRRVEAFISRRAEETGIRVSLVSANPAVPPRIFGSPRSETPKDEVRMQTENSILTIWYLSSQFFTTLLLAPSFAHAVLVANTTEGMFVASSATLLHAFFIDGLSPLEKSTSPTVAQRLRSGAVLHELLVDPACPVPPQHYLDPTEYGFSFIMNIVYLWTLLILSHLEELLYKAVRARFVPGQEPWQRWERALNLLRSEGVR